MAKTILIVDENLHTKQLKEGVFKFSNFQVKSVTDGKEALRVAKRGGIDIILSDCPMREIDEQEFVEQIKKGVSTKDIPIVMLAAVEGDCKKKILKEKGVSKYILRPFNVERLIKTVKKLAYPEGVCSQN